MTATTTTNLPSPLATYLILNHMPVTPTQRALLMALRENANAVYPALDYIYEYQEAQMQSLKIGKKYLLKTVTHYYAGTIEEVTLTDCVLGADAEIVFWTGRWPEAKSGKSWERANKIPPGSIISLLGVISAIPLDQ